MVWQSEDYSHEMLHIEPEEAPLIKFLNSILFDAIDKGASDIHFESYGDLHRIRLRLDGILYDIGQHSPELTPYLIARLKVMANLDIAQRRLPQDGRFKLSLSQHRSIDFRLNTCPTTNGEKAVVRILESSSQLLDIKQLGMEEIQQSCFREAITHPQGMILVTGPTGSGKTMTLYTALDMLNSTELNINSVEDPVEILMAGINQVQINLNTGLTFAKTLRAFLRQDPDIIMVGEIRDIETAEITVKAAQTGHLVFSTLHTKSAAETLVRLSDMGIPPFHLATSIILIIAQRLVRRLCVHCRLPMDIPENILLSEGFSKDELSELVVYRASSCQHCVAGYKGRTGIFEVLPISKYMTSLILKNSNSLELAQQAKREHMISLRRSGLNKVKIGITSLEELNRVIRENHC